MSRDIRTDYAAVNARGVTLYTFSDPAVGRAWVRNNAVLHDGLHLREVTVTTTSRRMYAPPVGRRQIDALKVPPMPVRQAAMVSA